MKSKDGKGGGRKGEEKARDGKETEEIGTRERLLGEETDGDGWTGGWKIYSHRLIFMVGHV